MEGCLPGCVEMMDKWSSRMICVLGLLDLERCGVLGECKEKG